MGLWYMCAVYVHTCVYIYMYMCVVHVHTCVQVLMYACLCRGQKGKDVRRPAPSLSAYFFEPGALVEPEAWLLFLVSPTSLRHWVVSAHDNAFMWVQQAP